MVTPVQMPVPLVPATLFVAISLFVDISQLVAISLFVDISQLVAINQGRSM